MSTNLLRLFAAALSLAASAPCFALDHDAAWLATIDGVQVCDRDAEQLRALVSPAPSRDAARRLAVDVARAHLWLRGWVAYSSARARLEAYRVLISTARSVAHDERELGLVVQQALDSTERGWRPPLRRLNPPREEEWIHITHPQLGAPVDVWLTRFDPVNGVRMQALGPVFRYQLELAFAPFFSDTAGPTPRAPLIEGDGRLLLSRF